MADAIQRLSALSGLTAQAPAISGGSIVMRQRHPLAMFNLRGPADEARLAETERAVREQYGRQSDPYYATSRLWDDGIIAPSASRNVLALALALATRRVLPKTATPVYRM